MGKLKYLDGMRGLAALIVVIAHFVNAFALSLKDYGRPEYLRYRFISESPLNILYNGGFAVCIFFVLSGYVLTYRFYRDKNLSTIIASASKRYIRLLIPILFSIFVAYILMKLNLMQNTSVGELTRSGWLVQFYTFEPSFKDMIFQAFYEVFFTGNSTYNTNLWTIKIEFFGSFMVFAFVALFGKLRNRYIIYVLMLLYFYDSHYLGFVFGVILSDLVHGNHEKWEAFNKKTLTIVLFILGIYFGSVPNWGEQGFLYKYIFDAFNWSQTSIFLNSIGAFFIVFALIHFEWMKTFFSTKPMVFLGRISFSLYVMHLLVICSFSSILFNILIELVSYKISVITVVSLSMILIFGVSYLTYKYVDAKGIALANYVYNVCFSPDKNKNSNLNDKRSCQHVVDDHKM